MKKFLFPLLALIIASCSSSEDVLSSAGDYKDAVNDKQIALSTEKAMQEFFTKAPENNAAKEAQIKQKEQELLAANPERFKKHCDLKSICSSISYENDFAKINLSKEDALKNNISTAAYDRVEQLVEKFNNHEISGFCLYYSYGGERYELHRPLPF